MRTDQNMIRLNNTDGVCVGVLHKREDGWVARERRGSRWQPATSPKATPREAAAEIGLTLTGKYA